MLSKNTFETICHPTNRVWPGTPDFIMASKEEAYNDGYQTGHNWKDSYRPGGPRAGFSRNDGRFKALYEHEKLVHHEWLRGFDDGRKHVNYLIDKGNGS